jgi:anti-sigma factor RsiW
MDHLTTDLIAYVMDDLPPVERARVESHLAACAECRGQRDAFRTLLDGLRASTPAPPDVHWGRWRADLRARLEARTTRSRWSWWVRPVPAALAAGMAVALVAVVWLGEDRATRRADLAAVEELVLSDRLDTLDLLEDLEVIRNLDRLSPSVDG